jgi:hypothetical protein
MFSRRLLPRILLFRAFTSYHFALLQDLETVEVNRAFTVAVTQIGDHISCPRPRAVLYMNRDAGTDAHVALEQLQQSPSLDIDLSPDQNPKVGLRGSVIDVRSAC